MNENFDIQDQLEWYKQAKQCMNEFCKGRYAEARSRLQPFIADGVADIIRADALGMLGMIEEQQGNHEEAIDLYHQRWHCTEPGTFSRFVCEFCDLAHAYSQIADTDSAIRWCRSALRTSLAEPAGRGGHAVQFFLRLTEGGKLSADDEVLCRAVLDKSFRVIGKKIPNDLTDLEQLTEKLLELDRKHK